MVALHCRDCSHWYGSEDDGYGPCTVKSQRGARRPLTYGGHRCDEGFGVVSGAVVFLGRADDPGPSEAAPPRKRAPATSAKRKRAAPAKRKPARRAGPPAKGGRSRKKRAATRRKIR